ncbi:hypothetical protein PDE_06873 [Penicillium oxalicum 114-2]|uniref:Uncharacterized protein n=1 Tax=Penicillium oxalicum (strain 114-2 / CGMCC 5302) TaxID=933388 RepID=S7ZNJ3_PENO1|nr:hypothetical protein PDE_06873 [Penicillium oxalicum 114-2]
MPSEQSTVVATWSCREGGSGLDRPDWTGGSLFIPLSIFLSAPGVVLLQDLLWMRRATKL